MEYYYLFKKTYRICVKKACILKYLLLVAQITSPEKIEKKIRKQN